MRLFGSKKLSKSDILQQAALEDLNSQNPKWKSGEYGNLIYSMHGSYEKPKPRKDDLKRANDWYSQQRHTGEREYGMPIWLGVAYIEAEGDDDVAVSVNGVVIDHLNSKDAETFRSRYSTRRPIRCRITNIRGERLHIELNYKLKK